MKHKSKKTTSPLASSELCLSMYRIRVAGKLDPSWSSRMEGMTFSSSADKTGMKITTLEGALSDQSALSGVINTLIDLQLRVLSVECLEPEL